MFLDAVTFGSETHLDIIDWFKSLPLWLDLGGIRVVHACWHEASMTEIEHLLSDSGTLSDELIIQANSRDSAPYDAIEVVLKGPEAEIDGYSYTDKDGHVRTSGRVTWWDPHATTLHGGIRIADGWAIFDKDGHQVEHLPDTPLPDWVRDITPTDPSRNPVIFGHYWFTSGANNDTVRVIDSKSACVDFSAVKGGPLVAYRWSGEDELVSGSLVTSSGR